MRPENEMKIKSYYSRTVEDAMAAARQEMGPDAMLVNSRKAPPEVRHLGEYEVVFANVAGAVAPAEAALRLPGERSEAPHAPANDRLSTEVAELKKELEGMRHAITRTAYAPAQWIGVSQDLSDAYATLTAAELSAELAPQIVQAAGGGRRRLPASAHRGNLQPFHHRRDAGPQPRDAAHRGSGGASRIGQDHHAGEARGELWSGGSPARPAALHKYRSEEHTSELQSL